MANLKTSKAVVNVGVYVGKQFPEVCIHEKTSTGARIIAALALKPFERQVITRWSGW